MPKKSSSYKSKVLLVLVTGALALAAVGCVFWKQVRCKQFGGTLVAQNNDPIGPKVSPKTGVPKPTQTRHVCIGADGEVLF